MPYLPAVLLKMAVSEPGVVEEELEKTRAGFIPTSRTGGEATESREYKDKNNSEDPWNTLHTKHLHSSVLTIGDLRQHELFYSSSSPMYHDQKQQQNASLGLEQEGVPLIEGCSMRKQLLV